MDSFRNSRDPLDEAGSSGRLREIASRPNTADWILILTWSGATFGELVVCGQCVLFIVPCLASSLARFFASSSLSLLSSPACSHPRLPSRLEKQAGPSWSKLEQAGAGFSYFIEPPWSGPRCQQGGKAPLFERASSSGIDPR